MNRRAAYWLILPSIAYLLLFFAYPMVSGFGLAGTQERGGFTGEHVRAMFEDFNFWPAVRTTALLLAVLLPLQFVVAMAMALVVSTRMRGSGILLYIYAIPLAMSEVAVGVIWYGILTQNGYLNSVLQHVGLLDEPYFFLAAENRTSLIICLVVAEIWRATAVMFVTLVSGLQAVPSEYGEACQVFGATARRQLFRVTLPLLKPSIQVALIIRVVLALQAFAVISILGGSGAQTLATEAFRQATVYDNKRVAAAYAGLILVIALLSVAALLAVFRTRPEERT